jgi:exopolyphosphatase/guanosine-5'-triphosphate,3'-diphosphate pyrophosphatase
LLALHKQHVRFSQGHHLGSLRLRKTLQEYRASATALRELMENEIRLVIEQIRSSLDEPGTLDLLAIGGDARFAASHMLPEWDGTGVATLDVAELAEFTDSVLEYSVDELVRKYRLPFPDAEALGPALLIYVRLAQILKLDVVFVSSISMRDGVLAEMAAHYSWTRQFTEQIISSALVLGEKYQFDRPHAEYAVDLCRKLFRALQAEHRMSPRYELLLTIAALLHEIGLFVSNRSHHKHSMYLIANCDLFGLGSKDLLLAALVARYHRRSLPKPTHEGYASLDRDERIVVRKLAAILRIADAMDRGHGQRIRDVDVSVKDRQLIIDVRSNVTDLSLEQLALKQKSEMFEQVYGMDVVMRRGRTS